MDKRKPFGEAVDLKAAVTKQAEGPKDAAESAAFDELSDAMGWSPVDAEAARSALKDFVRACTAKKSAPTEDAPAE